MKRQLRSSIGSSLAKDTLENGVSPNENIHKTETVLPKKRYQEGKSTSNQLAKSSDTGTNHDILEPDTKSRRVAESPAVGKCDDPIAPSSVPQPPCPGVAALQPAFYDRASAVLAIEQRMCSQLPRGTFVSGNVTHVYNPLEHAAAPHADYVRRCLGHGGPVPFLLVGMNPGPWGMSQTGVPFGEVAAVRDWMSVAGEVAPPADGHPQRPIQGFDCPRSEVRCG